MPSDDFKRELRMLFVRTVFLNLAAFFLSIIICGATLRVPLGLLCGSGVLFGTLTLLQISITRMAADAKRSGVTSQRRYLLFYGLRLLLFAAVFGTSLCLREWISPAAVCIPMLYPRLIYTAGALFQKAGNPSGGKKR